MALVAALFGLLIGVVGALGVASPRRLIAFVSRWQSQRGLYVLAAIRIGFGVALLLAASASRAPDLLRILGVIALVAGVVTPFFGLHRFEALLRWWSRQPSLFLRLWCVIAVGLGAGIVWAVAP